MKTENPVVLTLRIPFCAVLVLAGLILCVVWAIPQFTTLQHLGFSILLLPCILLCLWCLSGAVKLCDASVDTFRLFGLCLCKHRSSSDIRTILLQPDYQNDITSITLEFRDGGHLKLSGYYSNFYAARRFVVGNWPSIPHKLLPPTARPENRDDANDGSSLNSTFASGDPDD